MTQPTNNTASIERTESNNGSSMITTWTVDIQNGHFLFSRAINGRIDETYAPVSKEKAAIFATAIIQGYEPPKLLTLADEGFQSSQLNEAQKMNKEPFINAGGMSPEEFADKLRDISFLHSEFKGGTKSIESSLRVQRGELNAALNYVNRGLYFLTTPEIVHPGGHPNVTQEDLHSLQSVKAALAGALSAIDSCLTRLSDNPNKGE